MRLEPPHPIHLNDETTKKAKLWMEMTWEREVSNQVYHSAPGILGRPLRLSASTRGTVITAITRANRGTHHM